MDGEGNLTGSGDFLKGLAFQMLRRQIGIQNLVIGGLSILSTL